MIPDAVDLVAVHGAGEEDDRAGAAWPGSRRTGRDGSPVYVSLTGRSDVRALAGGDARRAAETQLRRVRPWRITGRDGAAASSRGASLPAPLRVDRAG